MRPIRLAALAFIAVAALASSAFAKDQVLGSSKVKVTYPDNWLAQSSNGDDVVTVADPTQESAIVFVSIPGTSVKKAAKLLKKQVETKFQKVKWVGKPAKLPDKLNGMDGVAVKGSGLLGKLPVKIGVVILDTPSGNALFVIGFVQADKESAHSDDMTKVVMSLTPQ